MQKPRRNPAILSQTEDSCVADWFEPERVPVTLVVDALSGPAWDDTRARIEGLNTSASSLTLCASADLLIHAGHELASALAMSGMDCSRLRLAGAGRLRPEVLPRSQLLAPEYACYPWSPRKLMCPAETAWVPMQLSLLPFVEDFDSIGDSLDRLVDTAEEMHEVVSWPTDRMERDAYLNRRIAIELLDIGRFATGRSPSEMHRCIGWISARLQARSSYWAKHREPLPAIIHADPTRRMQPSAMREQWRTRWRAAVETNAVRHRNLLVFSPWTILDAPDPLRLDLLSLLVHADAVCLAKPVGGRVWSETQRRLMEHRVHVALQQRQALDQIAKHI